MDVVASVHIIAAMGQRAGLKWPDWLIPCWSGPVDLSRRRQWVKVLASLTARESISLFRVGYSVVQQCSVQLQVVSRTELHFNRAAVANRTAHYSVPQLETGELLAILERCVAQQVPTATITASLEPETPGRQVRHGVDNGSDSTQPSKSFYYIAAGVGCGISEMEQEGFECVGACEIDVYCQHVLKRHHPHVPVHDNIKTLDLCAACGVERPLSLVVLSTPCVDVSSRGRQQAQDGEVCQSARPLLGT